jgi:hypothetical protein
MWPPALLLALLLAASLPTTAAAAKAHTTTSDASVQIWVGLTGGFSDLNRTLWEHRENVTDVAPFGLLQLSEGRLQVRNHTLSQRAAVLGDQGLGVWPVLGGSIGELRAALHRGRAMIAESVALAKAHGWRGFNLDFELHITPPQPGGCQTNDTTAYLAWLDAWSLALQAAGMGLQDDVGGCSDPFRLDFCGLSCARLRGSKLDRLITMHTYDDS